MAPETPRVEKRDDRETHNAHDAPQDTPCSALTAAVGEENAEGGARESAGRGSADGSESPNRRTRKNNACVRAGNARVHEFRGTKRSIVFRARTSRISVIAIASLEACPCVTQAVCPSIVRSRPTPSPVVN